MLSAHDFATALEEAEPPRATQEGRDDSPQPVPSALNIFGLEDQASLMGSQPVYDSGAQMRKAAQAAQQYYQQAAANEEAALIAAINRAHRFHRE